MAAKRAVTGRAFLATERAANNLSLLRFVAAGAVLFAHSWPIASGKAAVDPATTALSSIFGPKAAVSALAVHAFFVISGYLVAKSAVMRADLNEYIWARILRIYPALIVNVLLTAFVLGQYVSNMPYTEYLASGRLWGFVGNNILSWNATYVLPGVFSTNPLDAVNGSLWTLPLEIRCYVAVGALLAIGVLRRTTLFSALAAALLLFDSLFRDISVLGDEPVAACFDYFLIGALFFANRRFIPASPIAAIGLLAVSALIAYQPAARLAAMTGYAWLILWVGLAAPRAPWLERWIGDPSYGVYIYAFPIQQLIVFHIGQGAPWKVFVMAGAATLLAGILSWRIIEDPALAHKKVVANTVRA
ncbi:MAG TPA: acyltransferase, partial [Parvularculaceae bacterium]|nr:acyltransferase [Parvularculaceae bacterium]